MPGDWRAVGEAVKPRRTFEPTGKFDRVLCAVIAFTGLHTIFLIRDQPDLQSAMVVYIGWWLISTFYTIEWALLSYRKWVRMKEQG